MIKINKKKINAAIKILKTIEPANEDINQQQCSSCNNVCEINNTCKNSKNIKK